MNCVALQMHVGAYVDGELEPARSIDVEQHLGDCVNCRQEVSAQRNLKLQFASALRGTVAPEALRQRVARELDQASGHGRQSYGPTVLLTAAAAVVLLGASWVQRSGDVKQAAVTGAGVPIFGDIVRKHSHPLPTEIAADRPEQIGPWFRGKVAFQVHPVQFKGPRVRFLGARIDHVRDLSAATLYYDVDGHRVTAVVFEATPDMYEGVERMTVGTREVYFGNVHGYAVPMIRRGNVAYAFTGDLDQRNLLRVVATADLQ